MAPYPTTPLERKNAMKTHTTTLLAAAALLAFITTSAQAAITITDQRNFEGGTDGSPFNTGVYNINTNALIEADGSAQSPFHLDGLPTTTDTKGVVLNNSSTSNTPRFGADVSNYANASTQYVQFDLKATSIPHNASIEFRDGTNNSGSQGILIGLLTSVGNVQNRESGGFVSAFGSPVSLSLDTWYRYTITINPINGAADTYDLRVQSLESAAFDQTATGLVFRNNIADINSFNIFANTGTATTGDVFAIDNLRTTTDANSLVFNVIPTPTALPAGMALLAFAAMRRRK